MPCAVPCMAVQSQAEQLQDGIELFGAHCSGVQPLILYALLVVLRSAVGTSRRLVLFSCFLADSVPAPGMHRRKGV